MNDYADLLRPSLISAPLLLNFLPRGRQNYLPTGSRFVKNGKGAKLGAGSVQITDQIANDGTTSRGNPRVIAFTFFSAWLCLFFLNTAVAQEPRKAGKAGGLRVTQLVWGDAPLRERLTEFGKKYSVRVFLDRRIDPDQKIDLSVQDVPVEEVPAVVAEKFKLGACVVGSVHYIGPKGTTSRLPGVIAQRKGDVTRLQQARAAWNKSKPLKWDEAASPRDIAAALAQEAGATLENPEKIPHDVWPAYDLPSLTLTERLTLVLAGFDLTFQFSEDGGNIKVVPMPEEKAYASVYTLTTDAANIAAQVQRIFPGLKMERTGNRLTVIATVEEHERIDELLKTGKTTTVTKVPVQNKFTLTVENKAAGAVVNTVAKTLGKEFKYDPSLRDKLKENITLSVKDLTADELLTKTLKPLGLSYKMTETTLEVIPLP
jgi:hypothetical protein